ELGEEGVPGAVAELDAVLEHLAGVGLHERYLDVAQAQIEPLPQQRRGPGGQFVRPLDSFLHEGAGIRPEHLADRADRGRENRLESPAAQMMMLRFVLDHAAEQPAALETRK